MLIEWPVHLVVAHSCPCLTMPTASPICASAPVAIARP